MMKTLCPPVGGGTMQRSGAKRSRVSSSTSISFRAANAPREDAHVVSSHGAEFPLVLAVFDGHNGPTVADYCAQSLLSSLARCAWDPVASLVDLDTAVLREQQRHDPMEAYNWSVQGATAAVAVLGADGVLRTAVVGDSRVVVAVAGSAGIVHAVLMGTHDHNAREVQEQWIVGQRLGNVSGLWERAQDGTLLFAGEIQLTRALGDHYLKLRVCSWSVCVG